MRLLPRFPWPTEVPDSPCAWPLRLRRAPPCRAIAPQRAILAWREGRAGGERYRSHNHSRTAVRFYRGEGREAGGDDRVAGAGEEREYHRVSAVGIGAFWDEC